MKSLALLGSTGSIGRNTLQIVARFPDKFQVKTLAAKSSIDLLVDQIRLFRPEAVAVFDQSTAHQLNQKLPSGTGVEIMYGPEGYRAAASWDGVDMTVGAMVGAAGLEPVIAAIAAGKDIALANKETLVMAGELVKSAAFQKGVRLLPIDSEHSAIFQCLHGHRAQDLDKIILTASGGPFLDTPAEAFAGLTPAQALKHPNWQMGSKITIDSATLMNKGLEVIEAKWLFNLEPAQIDVLVHPQSIVHSMVAYCDGSMLAQMGVPDMQEAIAYALAYPERIPLKQPLPDLVGIGGLSFRHPDTQRFPCLRLAYDAMDRGGTMPAVMNAANEIAVHAFLADQLPFVQLPTLIEATMDAHDPAKIVDLDSVMAVDAWARRKAQSLVAKHSTI
jgi:1-deoxy-D-xylulose-5-phosphate reductoisomerase